MCARGCQRPCGCVCFVYTCAPDFAACKPENTDVPPASVVKHVSPTWLSARWESDWYSKDDPSAIESPILIRSDRSCQLAVIAAPSSNRLERDCLHGKGFESILSLQRCASTISSELSCVRVPPCAHHVRTVSLQERIIPPALSLYPLLCRHRMRDAHARCTRTREAV